MVHQARAAFERGADAYSLSALQQGMLYHALQGSRSVDVQQVVGELNEKVEPARFAQAWTEVMDRQPMLRTGFLWNEGGEPQQRVCPPGTVPLPFHYAEFENERAVGLALEAYLQRDRQEGFPTLAAPLLRVALFRAGADRVWFVATYHHLLLDARSMALLFREVMDRHDALLSGDGLRLPPAPPYQTFIDWLQTGDATSGGRAGAEPFWRNYLLDFTTPTSLPGARTVAEAGDQADAGRELMFRLPGSAVTRLRSLAQREDVTVNTIVQAAWALVLSRHSGENDVVFGALRAGRRVPVENADTMLGVLINTVPVRCRFTADLRIATWLRTLREAWVAMRPYEHTPLTRVQQWSEIKAGSALFETVLNYQEPSWDEALANLGGKWATRRFEVRSRPSNPLAIDVYAGKMITVRCFFEPHRCEAASVARLLGHFRTVLEALAADATEKVADLPLLTAPERQRLLVEWNRTSVPYPHHECIHSLVEAQAAAAPDRLAVSDAATTLTYGELNARANRLTRRLLNAGVIPGTPVAVCLERSVEMLVAWLAVLKAGGAFVPLDPGYPAERLAFQLEDCGAPVVLVRTGGRGALPPLVDRLTVLNPTDDDAAAATGADANPRVRPSATDVAYIIYTSGSTGQPKGVQIEHRALLNLVTWHQRAYQVSRDDRATQLASPAFDASIWETWPYLAAGASVHIPDDETRLSPPLLWRWLATNHITLAFMPTPLAEAVMSEPWPSGLALRALLTGGDTLKRRPPADFPCEVVNHYGPTESTVVATCGTVSPVGAGERPTIGRPIANTTTYVLDRDLRPVPIGVAGELYIGGESLARGYWNRPELNAEKFISLFSDTSAGGSVRVYRTGDRVRWTADGELEFLGRIDGQVKVRGCRIELGEVEVGLQAHPAVREALVVARPDDRGELHLVAYVLTGSEASPALVGDVLAFLRGKLPAYMIPAALVALGSWPLTSNGKIDRAALPAPIMGKSSQGAGAREANAGISATEELVGKTWQAVLGRGTITQEDNFFELGGHSLLAAQVMTRLNAALPVRVPVRVLFDHPTLGAFTREVDGRVAAAVLPRMASPRVKRRGARSDLELAQPN